MHAEYVKPSMWIVDLSYSMLYRIDVVGIMNLDQTQINEIINLYIYIYELHTY